MSGMPVYVSGLLMCLRLDVQISFQRHPRYQVNPTVWGLGPYNRIRGCIQMGLLVQELDRLMITDLIQLLLVETVIPLQRRRSESLPKSGLKWMVQLNWFWKIFLQV